MQEAQTKRNSIFCVYLLVQCLSEVETQLLLSLNLGYIDQKKYNELSEIVTSVWKQLNSLISSIKKRLTPQEQLPF